MVGTSSVHIIRIAAKLSLVAVKGLCQLNSAAHENDWSVKTT